MTLLELENKIIEASNAYYNSESPIMSDSEFDDLIDQLRSIDPNNKIFQKSGWGMTNHGHLIERKHSFFVGGLPKVKSSEIDLNNLPNSSLVTAKLDGISAVAYYNEGKLLYVLTRGDGETGLDITSNLNHCIPREIQNTSITWVRGEVVVPLGLAKLNGYSTERNMAAGLANSAEISDLTKHLKFVAYDSSDGFEPFISSMHIMLNEFELVRGYVTDSETNWEGNKDQFDYSSHDIKSPYLVDGIVVQENDKKYAVKFPNKLYDVEVVSVVNQVSPRGRVIPVIQIKPIKIDGVEIEYCSGFNYESIKLNSIGKGAVISIKRANEVIPHWERTISPGELSLPSTITYQDKEYETFWNGVHLEIKLDKMKDTIKSLISRSCPKGFANAKIEEFVSLFNVNTIERLSLLIREYKEDKEAFLNLKVRPNYSDAFYPYAKDLFENLSNGWTISEILESTYTRALGWVAAENISEYFEHNPIKLLEHLQENNGLLKDVPVPIYVVREGIKENLSLIVECLSLLEIKAPEKVSTDNLIPICLTGKLSLPRGKLLEEWKEKVYETDIGKAKYLITDNPDSGSSKNEKAKKLGVQVISEEEFRKLIGA